MFLGFVQWRPDACAHLHMSYVDVKSVYLKEVITLETGTIFDCKVRQEFLGIIWKKKETWIQTSKGNKTFENVGKTLWRLVQASIC